MIINHRRLYPSGNKHPKNKKIGSKTIEGKILMKAVFAYIWKYRFQAVTEEKFERMKATEWERRNMKVPDSLYCQ